MKQLTTFYNNITENNENSYLYFKLGDCKYGINIKHIVEVMKLPLLNYPQRLNNNAIGLLKYNDFTINVLDLRFYLNIKPTKYSVSNQLLVVKTDETIMALVIDKVEDIITLDMSKVEPLISSEEFKIIEFIYSGEKETISIINLCELENLLKKGVPFSEIDIPDLFPHDDDSQYELKQRNLILQDKANQNLITNVYSQDKFISFSVGNNFYCLDLLYIKEFIKNFSITKIPCDFDYIAGVIILRGDFVTIIDTKNFLSLNETKDNTKANKNIIIVEISDFKIGFLVDEIFNIINITEEDIQANTNTLNKYILSEITIGDKFYSILNMKAILSDEKFFIEET